MPKRTGRKNVQGCFEMVGLYFSGTGNTRHCIETLLQSLDAKAGCIPIERQAAAQAVAGADFIVLAYPVYFSNLPKIMRDFLENDRSAFSGKKVFLLATMGLFSGDGAGCAARLLKRYGAEIVGGLHLKMPDCIGDEKLLKKTKEENRLLVKQAEEKIEKAALALKDGHAPQEGLSLLCHMAGLFGQRLWFYRKTAHYSHKLKINWRCTAANAPCVIAASAIARTRRSRCSAPPCMSNAELKITCNKQTNKIRPKEQTAKRRVFYRPPFLRRVCIVYLL